MEVPAEPGAGRAPLTYGAGEPGSQGNHRGCFLNKVDTAGHLSLLPETGVPQPSLVLEIWRLSEIPIYNRTHGVLSSRKHFQGWSTTGPFLNL